MLEGYTFDVQRNDGLHPARARPTSRAASPSNSTCPAYIAGSDLEGGLGRFYLQASVTDQAQHTETSNLSLPVSQQRAGDRGHPRGRAVPHRAWRTSSTSWPATPTARPPKPT